MPVQATGTIPPPRGSYLWNSVPVKVYIAEIAHPRKRGMLGSIGTLAIVIGFVISYLAGVLCQRNLLAFIGGVFPALLVIFLYFMPETPLWLLRKKKRTEALESLVWLRGTDGDTEEECFNVESTIGTRVLFFYK